MRNFVKRRGNSHVRGITQERELRRVCLRIIGGICKDECESRLVRCKERKERQGKLSFRGERWRRVRVSCSVSLTVAWMNGRSSSRGE